MFLYTSKYVAVMKWFGEFLLALFAISSWLENRNADFIWYSAFVIIIFRAELALFMGVLLLVKLIEGKIQFFNLIKHCLMAGPVALGVLVYKSFYYCVC